MFHTNMLESHSHLLDMSFHKTSCSENDLGKPNRDNIEEYDTKSPTDIMDSPSGDDQDPNPRPKKKGYRRHTQRQIEEMEAYVINITRTLLYNSLYISS